MKKTLEELSFLEPTVAGGTSTNSGKVFRLEEPKDLDDSLNCLIWTGEQPRSFLEEKQGIQWSFFEKDTRLFEDVLELYRNESVFSKDYDNVNKSDIDLWAIEADLKTKLIKWSLILEPQLEYETFSSSPKLLLSFQTFLEDVQYMGFKIANSRDPLPKEILTIFRELLEIAAKNLHSYIRQVRLQKEGWIKACLTSFKIFLYWTVITTDQFPELIAIALTIIVELSVRVVARSPDSLSALVLLIKESLEVHSKLEIISGFIKGIEEEVCPIYCVPILGDLKKMNESRGRLYHKFKSVITETIEFKDKMIVCATWAKLTLGKSLYRKVNTTLRTLKFVILCDKLQKMGKKSSDLELEIMGLASLLENDLFFSRFYLESNQMSLDSLLEFLKVHSISGTIKAEAIVEVFSSNLKRIFYGSDGLKDAKKFKTKFTLMVDSLLQKSALLRDGSQDKLENFKCTLLKVVVSFYKVGLLVFRDEFIVIGAALYSVIAKIVETDRSNVSLTKIVAQMFHLECLATGYLFERNSTEDYQLTQCIARTGSLEPFDTNGSNLVQGIVVIPSSVDQSYSNGAPASLLDVLNRYFHFRDLVKLLDLSFPLSEMTAVVNSARNFVAVAYAAQGFVEFVKKLIQGESSQDLETVIALGLFNHKPPDGPDDFEEHINRLEEYTFSQDSMNALIKDALVEIFSTNTANLDLFQDRVTRVLQQEMKTSDLEYIKEARQAQANLAEMCIWAQNQKNMKPGVINRQDFRIEKYLIRPTRTRIDIILNYYFFLGYLKFSNQLNDPQIKDLESLALKTRLLQGKRFSKLPENNQIVRESKILPLLLIYPSKIAASIVEQEELRSFSSEYRLAASFMESSQEKSNFLDDLRSVTEVDDTKAEFDRVCDSLFVLIDSSDTKIVTVSFKNYKSTRFENLTLWPPELISKVFSLLFDPRFVLMRKQNQQIPLVKGLIYHRMLETYLRKSTDRYPVQMGVEGGTKFFLNAVKKSMTSSDTDEFLISLASDQKSILTSVLTSSVNWVLPSIDLKEPPLSAPEGLYILVKYLQYFLRDHLRTPTSPEEVPSSLIIDTIRYLDGSPQLPITSQLN